MTRAMALAALLAATPAAAFDPAAMTEAERAAFGAAIRDYLLENPGLVYEMLDAAERQRMADIARADREALADRAADLFGGEGEPVAANPDGDVTLTVFTDYLCPYCRRTEDELTALAAADPGLRIVIKHYPVLTPDSRTAAAFALAVLDLGGQALHAEVHPRLFALRGGYSRASLGRLAAGIGLDPDAVLDRMTHPEVTARLDANLALGQEFGLDATPSFALPSTLVRGHVPPDVLARYVNDLRKAPAD